MTEHQCCPWWLNYTFDHRLRRLLHKPERILADYVKPGMTALDVGCGMGFFSIPMARLVGDTGRVLSADVQQQSLDVLMRRARKAGVNQRIHTCLCPPDRLCVEGPVDFALAFYMVHETRDHAAFLKQVYDVVKPGGVFLIAEPKMHVKRHEFERTLNQAAAAGFRLVAAPPIRVSRSAILTRDPA